MAKMENLHSLSHRQIPNDREGHQRTDTRSADIGVPVAIVVIASESRHPGSGQTSAWVYDCVAFMQRQGWRVSPAPLVR